MRQHSWLCYSRGSQEPPSSGRSQLSFTKPWGAGKLVPKEPLLQVLEGAEVRRSSGSSGSSQVRAREIRRSPGFVNCKDRGSWWAVAQLGQGQPQVPDAGFPIRSLVVAPCRNGHALLGGQAPTCCVPSGHPPLSNGAPATAGGCFGSVILSSSGSPACPGSSILLQVLQEGCMWRDVHS